ncbi:MAG: acyltransferase [Oscillospiraceae bacterium]|nr:acyltransferase [Oscillospiraceae bacterium]
MKETSFFYRILIGLGLKQRVDYNSIEELRKRGVEIGENVHLYGTSIDFCHGFLVSIGNNVTLTGVTVLAHDASTQIPLGVSKVGRVIIGDNVFVGRGSIILPNVRIGNNVIVGAGSVVSRDIPDNSVVAGNPVHFLCSYNDYVDRHRQNMETRPVYHTMWNEKTDAEKAEMKNELISGIGYDK